MKTVNIPFIDTLGVQQAADPCDDRVDPSDSGWSTRCCGVRAVSHQTEGRHATQAADPLTLQPRIQRSVSHRVQDIVVQDH